MANYSNERRRKEKVVSARLVMWRGGKGMATILDVGTDDFVEEVLTSDLPVLVCFRAPWCGFCQLMNRVLEKVAEDYHGRLKVVRVNAEENLNLAALYEVYAIPETILFVDGQARQRLIGYREREELQRMINQAIFQA